MAEGNRSTAYDQPSILEAKVALENRSLLPVSLWAVAGSLLALLDAAGFEGMVRLKDAEQAPQRFSSRWTHTTLAHPKACCNPSHH